MNQLILDYLSDGRWGLFCVGSKEEVDLTAVNGVVQSSIIAISDSPTKIVRQFAEKGINTFDMTNSTLMLPEMSRFMIDVEKVDEMLSTLSSMKKAVYRYEKNNVSGETVSGGIPITGTFPGKTGSAVDEKKVIKFGKARRKRRINDNKEKD
jgi:hypothetical protein